MNMILTHCKIKIVLIFSVPCKKKNESCKQPLKDPKAKMRCCENLFCDISGTCIDNPIKYVIPLKY